MREKLLVFFLGILFALVVSFALAFATEFIYEKKLAKRRFVDPVKGPAELLPDNRALLGAEATKLGIFPPSPPVVADAHGRHVYIGGSQLSSLTDPPQPYLPTAIGGALKLPGATFRSIVKKREGDELIWDLRYGIDQYRRRVVPGESEKKKVSRGFIFMGDSLIFGEGVEDKDTLPAQLGRLVPRSRFYNYGLTGLFPGEMLDRVRLIGPGEISEKNSTMVYVYAPHIIFRSMRALRELAVWGYRRPYYYEDESGRIVQKETIQSAQPFRSRAADYLGSCAVCAYYHWNWPSRPAREDWEFLMKIFTQTRDEAKRLGVDKFYVVIYPGFDPMVKALIRHLEKSGIPYVDYSHWRIESLSREPINIKYEAHPNAEHNRIFAESLAGLKEIF